MHSPVFADDLLYLDYSTKIGQPAVMFIFLEYPENADIMMSFQTAVSPLREQRRFQSDEKSPQTVSLRGFLELET